MLAAAAGTKGDNQGKQILKQIEYLVKMYKLISHGEKAKSEASYTLEWR
jgi:acetolactate synthase small subunit